MADKPDDKIDLSHATSDELIAELQSRCDATAMAILLTAEKEPVRFRFSGPRLITRGLLADMDDYVRRCSEDCTAPEADEEHES